MRTERRFNWLLLAAIIFGAIATYAVLDSIAYGWFMNYCVAIHHRPIDVCDRMYTEDAE